MVKPDPLERREPPQDLRYILATLLGLVLLGAGAFVFWNVLNGGSFSGNVGREMGFAERIAATIAVMASGAGLLVYAKRGVSRLDRED